MGDKSEYTEAHFYCEQRPWGTFEILLDLPEAGYKLKRITLNFRGRLSLQSHKYRTEIWSIVQGQGIVTIGTKKINVKTGDIVKIPKMTKHRVENVSNKKLEFIEVQLGDYLGEDDITRYEDDYGRSNVNISPQNKHHT